MSPTPKKSKNAHELSFQPIQKTALWNDLLTNASNRDHPTYGMLDGVTTCNAKDWKPGKGDLLLDLQTAEVLTEENTADATAWSNMIARRMEADDIRDDDVILWCIRLAKTPARDLPRFHDYSRDTYSFSDNGTITFLLEKGDGAERKETKQVCTIWHGSNMAFGSLWVPHRESRAVLPTILPQQLLDGLEGFCGKEDVKSRYKEMFLLPGSDKFPRTYKQGTSQNWKTRAHECVADDRNRKPQCRTFYIRLAKTPPHRIWGNVEYRLFGDYEDEQVTAPNGSDPEQLLFDHDMNAEIENLWIGVTSDLGDLWRTATFQPSDRRGLVRSDSNDAFR